MIITFIKCCLFLLFLFGWHDNDFEEEGYFFWCSYSLKFWEIWCDGRKLVCLQLSSSYSGPPLLSLVWRKVVVLEVVVVYGIFSSRLPDLWNVPTTQTHFDDNQKVPLQKRWALDPQTQLFLLNRLLLLVSIILLSSTLEAKAFSLLFFRLYNGEEGNFRRIFECNL